MHHIRQALVRMRLGDADRAIARTGLIGRKKLAALRRLAEAAGWLDPAASLPEDEHLQTRFDETALVKRAASTVSTLDTYRERIAAWFAQGVDGTVIHATLTRDHGYTGSYSSVRRMLARLRGAVPVDTTVRLDYAPGEAAQVDFGAGPSLTDQITGEVVRTWVFVMTLCFSRHQYIEFVFDQTVLTWLGCHRRAFTWFGGIPARVIVDNAKCAITRACVHDPAVQRAYADCAEGYGFRIEACPPHDPQKKGIVEAGVKYVKRNFMALREFRDLTDLNAQGKTWVMDTAGRRRHGTTGMPPLERFELERGGLRPLPDRHPDLGSWHRVKAHRDCHVQFDRSWYSVPFALAGQTLWLKASPGLVTVQDGQYRQVAAHVRAERPGTRRTVQDHLPPDAVRFFSHDRAWCQTQAEAIGPACLELIETLLGDRIAERLRAAQGVIRLKEKYGIDRLEAACRRALDHGSPQYRTVKAILAGGHDPLPTPGATEAVPKPHGGRFARDAAPVLVVGPCGTGKSHLAQALGQAAVRQGKDVRFLTQAQLTANLAAARAVGTFERRLAQYAKVDLLILDDFGLKPLRSPADEDLHDLIAERYERRATLVTSNLDFGEWDTAFPQNRILAAATLDRLRHNAYCLTLDGESYRAPKRAPELAKNRVEKASKNTHP